MGSSKRRPLRTKRLLAQCAWIPVTQNQRQETRQKKNTRRGPTLRPRGAPPSPHSGEGRARSPVLALFGEITSSGCLEKCVAAKQNRRGKTKTKHKKHGNTLAASRPKRASEGASELKPRKFQENPKNAWGPEWHPEKAPGERTHGQNGRKTNRGGTKRRKKRPQPVRVGVSRYYLNFIS